MQRISILLVMLFVGFSASGQINKFKAAYTYNICRFIEWPKEDRKGDFIIGVVGNKQLAEMLRILAKKKKMLGQNIQVKSYSSVRAVGKCHVLYIGANYSKRLPEAVVKIGKNATLLVSEKNGALSNGAAVNFMLLRKKLAFEIKKVNATRQGLKINSKIYKLAAKVY